MFFSRVTDEYFVDGKCQMYVTHWRPLFEYNSLNEVLKYSYYYGITIFAVAYKSVGFFTIINNNEFVLYRAYFP